MNTDTRLPGQALHIAGDSGFARLYARRPKHGNAFVLFISWPPKGGSIIVLKIVLF